MRQQRITSTTLQVVSGTNAVAAQSAVISPAAQAAQAALAFASREWGTLEMSQHMDWNVAAAKWGPQIGLPADGASVYKSLVITKLLMGSDPAFDTVPDQPDVLPATPDFSVEATLSDTGVFHLAVVSAASPGPYLVAATASQARGTSKFGNGRFHNLEVSNLTAGSTAFTTSFLEAFRLRPSLGTKIAVQLTPLSPNGFRGTTVTQYTAVKPAPTLEISE